MATTTFCVASHGSKKLADPRDPRGLWMDGLFPKAHSKDWVYNPKF